MPPRRSTVVSQAQARATTSRRAAPDAVSEEEEEGERANEDGGETQGGGGRGGLSDSDIKSKAALVVRYALFSEYKRRPIPRPELMKHVNASRGFNAVFEHAQASLKSTFGMELVEARPRRKIGIHGETQKGKGRAREDASNGDGDEGDGQTQRRSKAPAPSGTKSYILRSILSPVLLDGMSQPRPMPQIEYDDDGIREDEEVHDSGALIRWEKGDGTHSGHIALLGIRTIILCLILCMGRVIQDDHLHALLRRLDLHRETVLPYTSTDSKEPPLTLDRYLDLLEKQRYLERTKLPNPNGQEEATLVEWRWGSREVEFSEKAATAFIEKIFYGETDDQQSESEEEEENGRRRRGVRDRAAEREAKKQKLREDIAKAAGGPLEGEL